VSAALQVIEQAATKGKVGVSYSGGKDSTVTWDLVRQIVPGAPAAFFDCGCEYDETYEAVRYYGATVIKSEKSLIELCQYGGYWGYDKPEDPDAEVDFFDFMVREPSEYFVESFDLQVITMGLRAQESGGRRMSAYKRGTLYSVADGTWHCCPLAHWTHDDIWAYIAGKGLYYNKIYDKMAALGIPREKWRVSALLGLCGARTEQRYVYLRQLAPRLFNKLAAMFPKIVSYT